MTLANPGPAARFERNLPGAAVIALAVLFIHWPDLRGGWLWDDISEFTANPVLRDPRGIGAIWFTPSGPDYLPLKSTVQWIEWQVWGANTLGYHAVSVAAHILSALLVWRLLARLGARFAWLGGVIFAIHPAAVESAAWISEQKNTLALPLLLTAMIAWTDRRVLAALLLFLASMLCKASGVMFPCVLLLHAWWKKGRLQESDFTETAPFFLVSIVLGAGALWLQAHVAIGTAHIAVGGLWERLGLAGRAVWFYLAKAFLPVGLMPLYPKWSPGRPALAALAPWLALAAGFAALWRLRSRAPARAALLGLGFMVLNLLPILGLVTLSFMRLAWVSDHFMYVSLVGAAGLCAAGAGWLWERMRAGARFLAGLAAGALAAGMVFEGHGYARVFESSQSLWAFAVAASPGSAAAHFNHANAMVLDGKLAEAVPEFRAAILLEPAVPEMRSNFGDVLRRLGEADEADAQYEEALKLDPGLVLTRDKLGDLLLEQGRTDRALAEYEAAVKSGPGYAPAQSNLAFALAQAGRLEEAEERYRAALRIDPANAENWDELGTVLAFMGRLDEALAQYGRALRIGPDSADTHNNMGLVLARQGKFDQAISQFELAVRLRPDFPLAKRNLDLARQSRAGASPPP